MKLDSLIKLATGKKGVFKKGQLKLSIYVNYGIMTVNIIQGRHLDSQWKEKCDSFVKICLVPDDTERTKHKTETVKDSNNPGYGHKFSFELQPEDKNKRMLISVWHNDQKTCLTEFLGCMSFGVKHLMNPKKETNGWYYLLTEDMGRKKHLQVSTKSTSQDLTDEISELNIDATPLSRATSVKKDHSKYTTPVRRCMSVKKEASRSKSTATPFRRCQSVKKAFTSSFRRSHSVKKETSHENPSVNPCNRVPAVDQVVESADTQVVTIVRTTLCGFGFSLTGAGPVRVNTVDKGSPAEMSGLRPGDCLICINGRNVSSSSAVTVAKLIKYSGNSLSLEVQRSDEKDLSTSISLNMSHYSDCDENILNNARVCAEFKDERIFRQHCKQLLTSTPVMARKVQTKEARRDVINQLVKLEMNYIDVMLAGIERYSRPLCGTILSSQKHKLLFQNIEKLVMMSEFLVRQLKDNEMYDSDSDESFCNSATNLTTSVGHIYSSKLHVICQAYESYAEGLSESELLLSYLTQSKEFQRFLKYPKLQDNQPTITEFVQKPVEHIRELHRVIYDITAVTSSATEELPKLNSIVQALQTSLCKIMTTNLERAPSATSLSSVISKDSGISSLESVKSARRKLMYDSNGRTIISA